MEEGRVEDKWYNLERKADDLLRYLTGDKNNPFDKGALGTIEKIKERLTQLIDINDHHVLEKRVMDLEKSVDKIEKNQIKYNFMTVIMWTALGGCAVLIIQYILSLTLKK